ncbi:signal peptidase I [Agaribacter flavus]|uniref:Signal peptidase I n=1 Tax=Agaribacter flavus TaxID=1902781 RepID=A0ABV7FV38_9ALTE
MRLAKKMNRNAKSLLKENWGFILFVMLLLISRSSIADWYQVPTGSMLPTIQEGDRILVDKMAYRLDIPFTDIPIAKTSSPERGDIVVFMSEKAGIRLVKRVLGIPGDNIAMVKNQVVLNGEVLQYTETNRANTFIEQLSGAEHPVQFENVPQPRDTFQNLIVPEGHYFVMGDNRNNSVDSRYYGLVSITELKGKATKVLYSLDSDNYFLPRAERFFSALP